MGGGSRLRPASCLSGDPGQVNWREPWLLALGGVHLAFFVAIVLARRSMLSQAVLFLTLGALMCVAWTPGL